MFRLFVNFKTYPQGTGEKAVELVRTIQEVSPAFAEATAGEGAEIIPVVQATDVYRIKQAVDIPVWVQHLDWQGQGAFTGWQNLEAVIEGGAVGTLLNHSEHPLPPGTIKQILVRVRDKVREKTEFQTMICCKTLGQMERLVKLKPDFIGYEVSELIGGKVSITEVNPKEIEHAIGICGKIPLVVGAGIHKADDLRKAKDLGAKGVLISSSVVLAQKPREKILALLSLLKEG